MTVAAITPFFTRPSISERLRGIENSLAESEYDLIIFNVETVVRRDELIREVPRRERVDGVLILSLSPCDEDVPILEKADVPIVLVDANHPSLTTLNRVIVDDVEGGRVATQKTHLISHQVVIVFKVIDRHFLGRGFLFEVNTMDRVNMDVMKPSDW
jgi:DNA-binding LacI/PurR family transcriptional regulator